MQHYFDLVARVHLHLYRRDWAAAYETVVEAWTPLRHSMIHHVKFVSLDVYSLRIRAALGLYGGDAKRRKDLHKVIVRDIKALKKSGSAWARAQADLFSAVLAIHTERRTQTNGLSSDTAMLDAINALDKTELYLFSGAARLVLGTLVGPRGDALAQEGFEMMESRGILRPKTMLSIYVPGFEEGALT